jgi:hypothetical protein
MALWSKVDEAAGKPKYLTAAEKAQTYGVSAAEATNPANKAKGVQSPGWIRTVTYTDQHGATRNKTETLVAMKSMDAGSVDNTTDDATIGIDPTITIGTQPTSASVTAPDPATFTVVATVSNGATPTYQWEVDDGTGYAAITGATSASYTVEDSTGLDGYLYRVVVSSTGAADVTSSVATLTVA